MKLKVNGKNEDMQNGTTVEAYLASKGIQPQTVAIEINMNVIEKKNYAFTKLSDGDVLEVVRFVGGGA